MKGSIYLIAGSVLTLTLAGCSEYPSDVAKALPLGPMLSASGGGMAGNVYTMTNASSGNAVLAYDRAADGTLAPAGSFSTGGNGSGGGLGNQGGLVISGNGRWLLAVNAGSNTIAAFRVHGNGSLVRTSTVPSGGMQPISVTLSGDLVYALNAGGSGNIVGFRLDNDGTLSLIPGSSRALSGAGVGPAQIEFAPRGDVLVVTEKATTLYSLNSGNMTISAFAVGADGSLSAIGTTGGLPASANGLAAL